MYIVISIARHMSSVSLPLVTNTDSATLSPTTTTPFLSTSMILLQDSSMVVNARPSLTTTHSLSTPVTILQDSIADALLTTLPQPSFRGGSMQFTEEIFPATTLIFGKADALLTTLPQPSSRGGNMQFTDESFPATTFGIATGVGAGFLVAIFIVLIVIAVFLLVWRRKRKYSLPTDHVLKNPMHGHKGKYMQPCMKIVEFLLPILRLTY